MKLLSEASPEEMEALKDFIKLEFIFNYNSETYKFTASKGEVSSTVSREVAEDILSSRFWMYILTKEVADYDEVESFKELMVEELCCIAYRALNVGEYPEEGQYSRSAHIPRIEVLKRIHFSIKFVDAIVDYLKKELTVLSHCRILHLNGGLNV